jgi:hypothetical protein
VTIAVNNIGTTSNTSGATLAISGVTAPVGSVIVVGIFELTSTASPGTVSDGVNTYVLAASGRTGGSGNIVSVYYAANASLSSGTITYTKHTSGSPAELTAVYVTGAQTSPLDAAVTATGTGSSSTPSLASGTPALAGEMFLAFIGFAGVSTSFTQDSGHGWATPPNSVITAGNGNLAGGSQVNAGSGAITFAPTLGASVAWVAFIIGLEPMIAFPQPGVLQTRQEFPHFPAHPLPQFKPGVQGPNVAPPGQVADRAITVQEFPHHPRHPLPFVEDGMHPRIYEDRQFFVIV